MLLQNLFLEWQAPLGSLAQKWGEEGAELLAVVLHRWIFHP